MISHLVGEFGIASSGTFEHLRGEALAEERSHAADFSPSRRDEFLTGRACARRALRGLGYGSVPIRVRGSRDPDWPLGAVGSITHCRGYTAAAVAPSYSVLALGIDAEPHARLPTTVLQAVTLDAERSWLTGASSAGATAWCRVLFSAKESIFKAWYPVTQLWLDFADVQVHIDRDAGTFVAEAVAAQSSQYRSLISDISGRWRVESGMILTAAVVARERRPQGTLEAHTPRATLEDSS